MVRLVEAGRLANIVQHVACTNRAHSSAHISCHEMSPYRQGHGDVAHGRLIRILCRLLRPGLWAEAGTGPALKLAQRNPLHENISNNPVLDTSPG